MDRGSLEALLHRATIRGIKSTADGFAAFCPFHQNTNTPAWTISVKSGAWLCWNPSCARTGNLFTLLVSLVGMTVEAAKDYVATIPHLATMDIAKGWALPPWKDRWRQADATVLRFSEGLIGVYQRCPKYMLERGFDKSFLREYEIGFDPKNWRVTFPIRDSEGYLVGFTRRTTQNAWPPYLHDTPKKYVLYLVDRVKTGGVVGVSEGTVDALRARQIADFAPQNHWEPLSNMTATLGGGLSTPQARLLLERRPRQIVLAFDNDKAGYKATENSIKILRHLGFVNVNVLNFEGPDCGDLDRKRAGRIKSISALHWTLSFRKEN